jgi:hypothetical protein
MIYKGYLRPASVTCFAQQISHIRALLKPKNHAALHTRRFQGFSPNENTKIAAQTAVRIS